MTVTGATTSAGRYAPSASPVDAAGGSPYGHSEVSARGSGRRCCDASSATAELGDRCSPAGREGSAPTSAYSAGSGRSKRRRVVEEPIEDPWWPATAVVATDKAPPSGGRLTESGPSHSWLGYGAPRPAPRTSRRLLDAAARAPQNGVMRPQQGPSPAASPAPSGGSPRAGPWAAVNARRARESRSRCGTWW